MAEPGFQCPLFTLNTVLFPGGRLRLRVFERRYLDMVRRCLREERPFVVVLIASGQEVGAPCTPHQTGVTVRVIDWSREPSGILGIEVLAERRVRIREWWSGEDRLLIGQAVLLATDPARPIAEGQADLVELLRRLLDAEPSLYPAAARQLAEAGWVAGRLAELLPLPTVFKQNLLEMDDPGARLALLREGLSQIRLLRVAGSPGADV